MNDTIEWAEPPPRTQANRRPGKAARFVEQLRQRPGQWAIYRTDAADSSAAGNYRRPYPECEWTGRRNANHTYTVYARWVGES